MQEKEKPVVEPRSADPEITLGVVEIGNAVELTKGSSFREGPEDKRYKYR